MNLSSKESIKIVQRLDSTTQVTAIEKELCGRFNMRCSPGDFDVVHTAGLVHFTNGVYDIDTTRLLSFSPSLYRGMLSVGRAYDANAQCPLFERVVFDVLYGDPHYIKYLQRLLGYALIGAPVEQIMFIALGGGANGKTTLFEAVRYAMGEYATVGRSSTLMDATYSTGGAPREDLLRLIGKRFVLTEEMDNRGTLNESLVKQLTGGAEFVARGLFERKSTTFHPTWVGVLTANWAPTVRGTDVGIWRRLQVLPFARNLLKDPTIKVDKMLPLKLRNEAQGIMTWLLKGAVEYSTDGLGSIPVVVSHATEEYQNKMDLIAQWARDMLQFDDEASITNLELYTSWSVWANSRGVNYVASNAYKMIQIFRLHFEDITEIPNGFNGVGLRCD